MPTSSSSSIARLRAARRRHAHVQPQHLGDLVADGEHRVERRHRLLEDHRDVLAAQVAQLARSAARRRLRPPNRMLARADRRSSSPAAAGPGSTSAVTLLPLPDSPTSATVRVVRDVERDALHRLERSCCGRGGSATSRSRTCSSGSPGFAGIGSHRQCPLSALELRIERVAQRVGEQRERGHQHRHRGAAATSCHHLPRMSSFCASFEHRCPTTRRRPGTPKPEERQDHLGLDEADRRDRQLHQRRRGSTFGKMCTNMRARVRGADRVRRLHVLARLVLQVLGADQPEDAGPAGEPEDQDDRQHPLLLQHRGDREDQQDVRDRGEDAVEPVEHVVDPAAVVAGDRAEQRADERSRRSAAARPTKIDISEPLIVFCEHVAAPLVAAERQRRARASPTSAAALSPLRADVLHHVGERIDALPSTRGGAPAGFVALELGDHVGERVDDRRLAFAGRRRASGASGAAGAPASMSAPRNDGGA